MSAIAELPCPACGQATPAAGRFCVHCAAPLAQTCPTCGTPAVPGASFCMQCATPLRALPGAATEGGPPSALEMTVSERRLVSVLFADLVGFTSLSEHRDPEEVRDLLSEYFERCRRLIERYGGTVEKFIGDAVMAVWGTPVAREDDAERAVRAGLALVNGVSQLGREVAMPDLRLRVGVLTGSAAVERGAEAEGMVLGDTVNTAARLQSIAAPGTVLVDDVTRRASEAAIAYEDAGSHRVKGREQPVRAWTALRVVAGAGGARRSAGLEAPFVGRDRELQCVVDAGEESAGAGQARHVTIVGEPGLGKSRLMWEFFKYLDGIEETRWWHQGRCLAYGEGVAYWALAEMVRARAGIAEEDASAAARSKLHEIVDRFVPDPRERRLVEPRLAHLLRLEERADADRADLFSGWRLFFERMADSDPVILVFEDLQWADSGLLDFIDYLLEWSAEHPIFVLALARPELLERRPLWRPVRLDPLAPEAVQTILEGLVPGLPAELVAEIGRRAEGIPLYAVETVRMLQDRGVLVQEGARYVVTGDVSDLDVPETLHALVASRLDGLSAIERSLLQDASVLGLSFTAAGAAALSERPEAEVAEVLDRLVAKQVLARDDDPRSPDRGQYVFLQALVRTVAYGTLPRRVRKQRHLSAARHLERTWPGEARDIAEVLASHYLEAIAAEPQADDVPSLRAAARERLTAAGRAAASLALGPEAERYLEQAANLADDELEQAELYELAGWALVRSGRESDGEERLRQALALRRSSGLPGGSSALALANTLRNQGRTAEAGEVLEASLGASGGTADPVLHAETLAELAVLRLFEGQRPESLGLLERALETLEAHQAWAPLANALATRGAYLSFGQRYEEATAVLSHALALAERHDLPAVALRCHNNLVATLSEGDRFVEGMRAVDDAIALARERGDRFWERRLVAGSLSFLVPLGRWDEAMARAAPILSGPPDLHAIFAAQAIAFVAAARGDEATLERCLAIAATPRDASYVDQRISADLVNARIRLERGDALSALTVARELVRTETTAAETIEESYAIALEAAIRLSDRPAMTELAEFVAGLTPGRRTPLLRAGADRFRAELAWLDGHPERARAHDEAAIELLRSINVRPVLAKALEERGRRGDAEALDEARAIYIELGAVRWLERLDRSLSADAVPVT